MFVLTPKSVLTIQFTELSVYKLTLGVEEALISYRRKSKFVQSESIQKTLWFHKAEFTIIFSAKRIVVVAVLFCYICLFFLLSRYCRYGDTQFHVHFCHKYS